MSSQQTPNSLSSSPNNEHDSAIDTIMDNLACDESDDLADILKNANPKGSLHHATQDNDGVIDAFFDSKVTAADYQAGFVAIVGRPNVGKSTLMNHLLGQKLSITSRKPQTTRHRIHGIYSDDGVQMVFVDTPGIHSKTVRAINERMNAAAVSALNDVDVVLFVVDGVQWREDDLLALEKLAQTNLPIVLVINKSDTIKDKAKLLPIIEEFSQSFEFADIIPVSALRNTNLDRLIDVVRRYLPKRPPIFDPEQITDRSERFLASEIIREKIMRLSGDEVPYDLTVQIDGFKDEEAHKDPKTGKWRKACTFIDATIFVERAGQKSIVIGDKGSRIKQVGIDARADMEKLFDRKIMLTLWVKVKKGWSDDERALNSLGY